MVIARHNVSCQAFSRTAWNCDEGSRPCECYARQEATHSSSGLGGGWVKLPSQPCVDRQPLGNLDIVLKKQAYVINTDIGLYTSVSASRLAGSRLENYVASD